MARRDLLKPRLHLALARHALGKGANLRTVIGEHGIERRSGGAQHLLDRGEFGNGLLDLAGILRIQAHNGANGVDGGGVPATGQRIQTLEHERNPSLVLGGGGGQPGNEPFYLCHKGARLIELTAGLTHQRNHGGDERIDGRCITLLQACPQIGGPAIAKQRLDHVDRGLRLGDAGERVGELRTGRVELALLARDEGQAGIKLGLGGIELTGGIGTLGVELELAARDLSAGGIDLGLCARKLAGGCVERLVGLAAALVDLREGIVLHIARALRLATLANLLDASLGTIDELLVFIRVGHELGGAGNTKVGDGKRIAVHHGGGREEERVLRTAGATEAHGLAAGVHIHGIEHGCGDGVTAALENRRCIG